MEIACPYLNWKKPYICSFPAMVEEEGMIKIPSMMIKNLGIAIGDVVELGIKGKVILFNGTVASDLPTTEEEKELEAYKKKIDEDTILNLFIDKRFEYTNLALTDEEKKELLTLMPVLKNEKIISILKTLVYDKRLVAFLRTTGFQYNPKRSS